MPTVFPSGTSLISPYTAIVDSVDKTRALYVWHYKRITVSITDSSAAVA